MAQMYDRSIILPIYDICTGGAVFHTAGGDKKVGQTSKPPYHVDLPYERRVFSITPGVVKYKPTSGFGAVSTCFGNLNMYVDDDPNWATVLVNRMATKVRGHDFSPGVSLGEANESLRMIGHSSRGLAKGAVRLEKDIQAIRASRWWGRSSRYLRKARLDGLWLEAVYGWTPLIRDVDSSMAFLASALNKPRQVTYRVNYKRPIVPVSPSPVNVSVTGFGTKRYYMVLHLKEKSDNLAYTGITNMAAIAYQLVPYSFVVDWFLPIGSWLEARAFLADLDASGCYGYIQRFDGRTESITNAAWELLVPQRYKDTHFVRVAGIPTPQFPSFRPLFSVLSNWRHCLDGLALAEARFRRLDLRP